MPMHTRSSAEHFKPVQIIDASAASGTFPLTADNFVGSPIILIFNAPSGVTVSLSGEGIQNIIYCMNYGSNDIDIKAGTSEALTIPSGELHCFACYVEPGILVKVS